MFIYLLHRWDNLGVLGLVCRLYSEREENDKKDDLIKNTDLKNEEDFEKTGADKFKMDVKSQSSKWMSKCEETKNRDKADQGIEEDISFPSDSSVTENDENEDEITLFTFENEFLWDEV